MTKEEYNEKLRELEVKKKKIMRDCAFANSVAKSGDTVINKHNDRIIVDNIMWCRPTSMSDDMPQCSYTGIRLTTKGVPYKNGERYTIYQHQIKRVNGVPV